MSLTDEERNRVFALVKPVVCGSSNGSAFPITAGPEGVWYVTCAHVLKTWNGEVAKVCVGGIQAKEVIDGSEHGLDLAMIRLDASIIEPLRLWPVSKPPQSCHIPGCYHPATEIKSFLREPRDAHVNGLRTDVISEDGTCEMEGWALEIQGEANLVGGYSGSPVVCVETGWVFAVAVMKTEGGKGGIAISIANLKDLLTNELKWVLPEKDDAKFDDLVVKLFTRWQGRVTLQDIRRVCQQSSPPGFPLDWLRGNTIFDYCHCLLDRTPFEANNRQPLYDVLALLESKADNSEKQEIQQVLRQLEQRHPGLVVTNLPQSEPSVPAQPALIEIVFDPRGSEEQKGYAVHSFWRTPGGEHTLPGPCREDREGERLELGSADLHVSLPAQVCNYAFELMAALDEWDPEAQLEIVFLFRLPHELLLYPVENWPKSRLLKSLSLGREHPVVVAARERPKRRCSEWWNRLNMDISLKDWLWHCHHAGWPEDEEGENDFIRRIKQSAIPVFMKVPALGLLEGLIGEGVGIALWPRDQEAETGIVEMLQQNLKHQPLENLRFALRNLRKNPGEHDGIIRHLTLLWDDPSLLRQGHFHHGLG